MDEHLNLDAGDTEAFASAQDAFDADTGNHAGIVLSEDIAN